MKKLILLLSLFSLTQTNAQQNLVLNPSFEENFLPIPCGAMQGTTFPITNWTYGSLGTSDVFSTLVQPNCYNYGLQNNQSPRTGNNYLYILNLISTTPSIPGSVREYIRGRVSTSLQVGTPYIVEFYVRKMHSNSSNAGMNNIGVKFINDSLPIYPTTQVISEVPDLNYSGPPIIDEDNWTLLSFIYIPTQSNLNAFIIGNFFSDNQTNVEFLYSNSLANCNYLIDDVAIYTIDNAIDLDIPEEICQGDILILPTVSNNNVTGTWSPASNNQVTTIYTFTPNDPLFPTVEKTVVVNPKTIPDFDKVEIFCDEFPTFTSLPSISNDGVKGTWSPVFNPNQSGIYTFTPNPEFCSDIVTIKVIIDKTPIFDAIEPFCEPDLNFSLPTISTNGISGSWSPAFDPYNSQTYTFTRDSGDCTQQVILNVVVYPQLNFSLNSYCNEGEFFVEIITNNFSFTEITNIQWLINNSSISESGNIINLSNYSHLLQESNIIEIIFTDSNGCLHTTEVIVLGEYLCKIQKGISPNGDVLNEYFDLVSFGGVDLKIFNRYGSIVYEKSSYTNQWKGQSKSGKQLPTGTYFYVIKTKLGEKFSGYIQLTY